MSFETVLASERVYEGRILNLRVDEIRTPTGVEALREIVENGGAVAMVAVDDQQRVVLVKQYRHAVRAWSSRFLPANWMAMKIRWKARSGNCVKRPVSARGALNSWAAFYPAPGLEHRVHLPLSGHRPDTWPDAPGSRRSDRTAACCHWPKRSI